MSNLSYSAIDVYGREFHALRSEAHVHISATQADRPSLIVALQEAYSQKEQKPISRTEVALPSLEASENLAPKNAQL